MHVGDFLIFLDLEHENVSLVVESQNSASRKVIFNDKKYNLSNKGTLQFEMKKVPDKYVEIIIYTPMWQLCAPMLSWVQWWVKLVVY